MTHKQIVQFLKIIVALIFIGRAWQHLVWDAPYRAFFWDESLLKPVVESIFNTPWHEYVTSEKTDQYIQGIIRGNGVLYLIAAISSLFITNFNKKWVRIPIFIGSCSLVILAVLLTKEKFYHTAQFFEHSIQFGLPFALLYVYGKKFNLSHFLLAIKILIAVTFFSHGLYAFGFYPVPGNFVDMVINIMGCTEDQAKVFLYIAGVLDFIIAVLIFIPRVSVYALWYAVVWGLLTAMARIVANVYFDFFWQSVNQNLFEVLYRLSHGLTPFIAILLIRMQSKQGYIEENAFSKSTL